ncbi:MAG: hypothetical protein Q7T46_11410 [Polaromonas sp.]|nr:hypothetical protein [Polaromonas sp.]
MPLDPSIILGVKRPQFTSPQEMYAQKAQFDQNELAQRLGGLKVQEFEQGQRDQNQLRNVYSQFGKDTEANINALYKAGLGKEAGAYAKSQADQQKSVADTQKAQIEAHLKKLEVAGQILSGVRDQSSWDAARAQTAQMLGPEAAAMMPPQFDAALVEQKRNQALSVKDQLEQKWKAMAYTTPDANARLSADTSRANNAASVGASYANAAATRSVAASNVEAAKIKGDRDTEMKIADDYRAQSKTFKEVSDAYKTINATLDKATTSAAATLAGATKFMKLLDPGSVVRESELGMALAATGVFDRATNYVNTLKYGKVLTPSQAADFKNITAQIYAAAQAGQKQVDDSYKQQAKTYGLRPEMIVQDLGQDAPAASGKSSANIDALLDKYK